MSDQIWVNPRQPQTLYISQMLMYIRGVFAILGGWLFALGSSGLFITVFALLITVGMIAGAYGIANEKKWGYRLGVAAAAAPVALAILGVFLSGVDSLFSGAIGLMFDIALLALLLHPMSAEYQKVWFR